MVDFASALRTRLVEDEAVAALAGTRIYWGIVPQNVALPAVRLTTVSDDRPENLQRYDATRAPRVQVDCFALKYAVARDLAEKIVAALAPPATVAGVVFGRIKAEGPRDLGEDTAAGYVHRLSVDLLVEHRLA